jgi:co-chaperonin GroES (HSP10)
MTQTAPQLIMIGHLDIWTVTVGDQITQSRDYMDVLTAIGQGAMDPKSETKYVEIQEGSDILFRGYITVKEVAA